MSVIVTNTGQRVNIYLDDGKVRHCVTGGSSTEARVVMTRTRISVGCTDTTPETLEFLLAEHKRRFSGDVQVVQDGTPRSGSQWRPIETAPKDGTPILVSDGNTQAAVYWWPAVWMGTTHCGMKNPTHWMPLPSAPCTAAALGAPEGDAP